MGQGVAGDLLMRGEPHPGFAVHVLKEPLQHPHAIPVANHLGVHGQNKDRALLISHIELIGPDLEHVLPVPDGHVMCCPIQLKQGPIVEDPFDGSCMANVRQIRIGLTYGMISPSTT